jgi:hypothetical protein
VKFKTSIFTTFLLLIGGVSLLPDTAHGAINGKLVTVIQSRRIGYSLPDVPMHSKMIVVTINNGVLAKCDTILRDLLALHPVWSFDGTRIVFFRQNHGLSMINADGTNLRDIWKGYGHTSTVRNPQVEWPGAENGKWVYFNRTEASSTIGTGRGAIWRVNVDDTTQVQPMLDYYPNNDEGCKEEGCTQRWNLSQNARYAMTIGYSISNTVNKGPNSMGDAPPHLFPRLNNGQLIVPRGHAR